MERDPGDLARLLFRGASPARSRDDHPDDESLAALLESRTPEQADPEVVEHLTGCDACRREWIRMKREAGAIADEEGLADPPWRMERSALGAGSADAARRSLRGRVRPLSRLILAGAAALILAGVALLVPWHHGSGETLRSRPAPQSLQPLAPTGEIPAGAFPAFRWTAAPGATAYVIVVADAETGRTVLRAKARETRHLLSTEQAARLTPGRTYRWLIRAERGTGRTRTGPPATFSILPAH